MNQRRRTMPVFFLCSACLAFARATDDDVCPNGQYRLSRRRRYDWNSRPEDDSDEARSAARDSVTAAIRNASVLEIGGPTKTDLYDFMRSVDNVVERGETAAYFHQPEHPRVEDGRVDGAAYVPNGQPLGQTLQRHGTMLYGVADLAYDAVFASHVLEHFVDPLAALIEWDRVLRPGGALVLVVPWAGGGKIWYDEHKEPATMQELLHLHAVNASFDQLVLRRRAEQILRVAATPDARHPYVTREQLFSLCPSDGRVGTEECDVDENLVHWHVWDFDLLEEVVGGCLGYQIRVMSLWNDFHQLVLAFKPPGTVVPVPGTG